MFASASAPRCDRALPSETGSAARRPISPTPFPPYASSALRATTYFTEKGAVVVAITDTPISPVGQRVDIVLPAMLSGLSTQHSFVAATAVANAVLNGVIG